MKINTLKDLASAYSSLVGRLMKRTKEKRPSKRVLKRVDGILDEMKELAIHVRDFPKYFDEKGNALVTLLRHGAAYLGERGYHRVDESLIGNEFAYNVVMNHPDFQFSKHFGEVPTAF